MTPIKYSMPQARSSLRAAVHRIEPAATDYIDWETFERELEREMSVTDVAKVKVAQVFGRAVTRARNAYHAAVQTGVRWKQ